jgi:arylsulfatase A-like enzyme
VARRAALGVALLSLVLVALYANVFDCMAPAALARAAPAPPGARGAEAYRVLLVSVDGLAPAVMEDVPTPTLDRLAAEGLRARHAETVMPSRTLPAHVSMISGVPPRVHGVGWNRYEPWRRLEVETLFSFCAREGWRCGLFAGKAKFAHLAEYETGVEHWALGTSADSVLAQASAYLAERDPDFVLVHLAEVDLAGHAEGWGSPAQHAALERIDALLGRFLAEARAAGSGRLAVLLTSDHGGHGTVHGSDDPRDLAIPWILYGPGIDPGTLREPVSTLDTGPSILALLGVPTPPAWQGRAWLRVDGTRAAPAGEAAR